MKIKIIKMISKCLFVLSLVTAIICVDEGATKISTNRNSRRVEVCQYYSDNFTDTERSQTQPLINAYSYLSDEQIEKMMFEDKVPEPGSQTILMVLPHCIGLAVLVLMWPGLCCCCVWPEKFPVCKKCRKPEKEMYGKCQLKWPAYLSILCYLLIVIGASAALASAPNVTNDYNNIGCQLMAVADDTLNGRISPTDSDTFFVGISPLNEQLETFKAGLNTFFTESNSSLNNSQSIRSQQVGIQGQITSEYTSYVNIVYTNAFKQSDGNTFFNVNSAFKTMYYGPETDDSTILGNMYAQLEDIFEEVNTALDPMIQKWVYLQAETKLVVEGRMTDTQTSITAHQSQLKSTIQAYDEFSDSDRTTTANILIKMLYGFILGLGLLGLVSAIIITCCTVVRIRLVIYCTCSFLLLFGVITFVLTIYLGVMVPNYAQFCAYADEKLSTAEGRSYLFTKLEFNSSASLYQQCYGEGVSGDIIEQINSNFYEDFYAMDLISDYTLQFNDLIPNFNSDNLQQPFDDAAVVIEAVKENQVWEIQDTDAIAFLNGLAQKVYTPDAGCTNAAVYADSWVPTRDLVSCQAGSFAQAVCSDLSDFMECEAGCYEMYWELTDPAGDPAAYETHLAVRYGNPCNYVDYVTDLHEQWTLPRMTEMDSVTTDLALIESSVDTYDTALKTIQASLNSFKSNLEANYNSQTNLTSGSFNGVDCRVVGQTITELRDSFCVGFLFNLNYNFVMLTIISYSILLLGCVSVCTGVRHFQHLQKMQIKVGYKGVPVSISSNRIIDKFDA